MANAHLEKANFPQGRTGYSFVVFVEADAFQCDNLVCVSIFAFEHRAVRALADFLQLFIFLHDALRECHRNDNENDGGESRIENETKTTLLFTVLCKDKNDVFCLSIFDTCIELMDEQPVWAL